MCSSPDTWNIINYGGLAIDRGMILTHNFGSLGQRQKPRVVAVALSVRFCAVMIHGFVFKHECVEKRR